MSPTRALIRFRTGSLLLAALLGSNVLHGQELRLRPREYRDSKPFELRGYKANVDQRGIVVTGVHASNTLFADRLIAESAPDVYSDQLVLGSHPEPYESLFRNMIDISINLDTLRLIPLVDNALTVERIRSSE